MLDSEAKSFYETLQDIFFLTIKWKFYFSIKAWLFEWSKISLFEQQSTYFSSRSLQLIERADIWSNIYLSSISLQVISKVYPQIDH